MNIFENINTEERKILLNCLQAVQKTYQKDEIILDIGEEITSMAYILEGSVQIARDDYEGSRIIINTLTGEDAFAEALVCAGVKKSPICVTAIEDTKILFLNFNRILTICTNACRFHQKLLENIIKVVAQKNLMLQERIELLAKKTIKDRILYMLRKEQQKSGKDFFEIPYSREQMAIFIGADRSALSRELSNMKASDLIDYHKNMFRIIEPKDKGIS